MELIPFGEWMPDQPALRSPGVHDLQNVVPMEDGNYGPAKDLSEETGDMSVTFSGMETVTGAIYLPANNDVLVGAIHPSSASQILGITNPFDGTWYDLSHTTYPTGNVIWNWAVYKDMVIGVYGNGSGRAPVKWSDGDDVTADTVSDLGGSPPPAEDVLTVRDFVVMLSTYDATDGSVPERIWWGANGDPDDWPTVGTADARQKESSHTDLLGGGTLVTGKPGVAGNDAVIWAKDKMWAMNRQPAPVVWSFDPIAEVGAYLRKSVVAYGARAWFLSDDGFMEIGPDGLRNIGAGKINQWFFDNFRASGRIYGAVESIDSRVLWQFTSTGNDYPDMQLSYNWITGMWGQAVIASHAVFYAPVDTNYQREGAWFVSENFKLARMTGSALQAILETKEYSSPDANVMWIERVYPIIDGDNASDLYAKVNLRNWQHEPGYSTDFVPIELDGGSPVRLTGRYARVRCRVPAGVNWNEGVGARIDARPFGKQTSGRLSLDTLIDDSGNTVVDSSGNVVRVRQPR